MTVHPHLFFEVIYHSFSYLLSVSSYELVSDTFFLLLILEIVLHCWYRTLVVLELRKIKLVREVSLS